MIVWNGKRAATLWLNVMDLLFLNWCGQTIVRNNWTYEQEEFMYLRGNGD